MKEMDIKPRNAMKERNIKFNNNILLGLFDNTNLSTDVGVSPSMRIYYTDYQIDNAKPYLVHDQFAQQVDIPANSGKTVEFDKYTPYPKALTPLQEGVTPSGRKMEMTKLQATVQQYGDYTELADVLILTSADKKILKATELHGQQSGETLDTVTREVINGGTCVQYAEGQVNARNLLTAAHKLTVKAVQLAVRFLKNQKAKKINGYYVAIAHPDTLYDLMQDPAWVAAAQYAGSTQIFEGEVGRIAGVRFVETTEAKIWEAAGAGGISVYSTLFLGANAYGTTKVKGGGLEHIVKQLGSAGTADPLNQRATVGWKAIKTAVRLVETFMIRVETGCTFNSPAN